MVTYTTSIMINKILSMNCIVNKLKDIYHPELIKEWKQKTDEAAYEKNLNKEIKLPFNKKEIYLHDRKSY